LGISKARVFHPRGNYYAPIVSKVLQTSYAWFSLYIEECGEFHPKKNEIHLLFYIPRMEIWECMIGEEGRDNCLAYDGFNKMIASYFAHVKWPRQIRLGICDLCIMFNDAITAAPTGQLTPRQIKANKYPLQT
jgi:hypothetical protein